MALVDFVEGLGACSVVSGPGIADEHRTRQDAELLMSLLSSSPPHCECWEQQEPISSSESEHSFGSAEPVSARRSFRFTCPSLSLETPSSGAAVSAAARPSAVGRIVSGDSTVQRPATLLQRTLMVDDPDALRLSADAMTRNVRQTLQTALQFRIDSWVQLCAAALVKKEQALRKEGATSAEVLQELLLYTQEARVIQCLEAAVHKLQVTSTTTTFTIQGCAEEDGASTCLPIHKKQRLESYSQSEEEEEYTSKYSLVLKIIAALQTPAGFSEIVIDVPGTIESTFCSSKHAPDELKSVDIEINTDILAAMVEKSTRTVVRVSVESLLTESKESSLSDSSQPVPTQIPDIHSPAPTTVPVFSLPYADKLSSALVTPARARVSSKRNDADVNCYASPKPVLLQIPDNLEKTRLQTSSSSEEDPRRISPQPHTFELQTASFLSPRRALFQEGERAMISPPVNESAKYYEDCAGMDGPSLPLLVAAACQAMQS
jgi:hypothetical protein